MNSKYKNYGLWISILMAILTAYVPFTMAATVEQKMAVIVSLLTVIMGIISNPSQGTGFLDK